MSKELDMLCTEFHRLGHVDGDEDAIARNKDAM